MTAILTSVSLADMASGPWTDAENDLIVADYFAMLAADLAGRPHNKAGHNRRLRGQIDRSRPSIEFKHRNISAVLKGIGESWITGYLPAFNIQMSLADAVGRWLHRHPEFEMPAPHVNTPADIQEIARLVIELPPTLKNHPRPMSSNRCKRSRANSTCRHEPSATERLDAPGKSAYLPMNRPSSPESAVPTWRGACDGCQRKTATERDTTSKAIRLKAKPD